MKDEIGISFECFREDGELNLPTEDTPIDIEGFKLPGAPSGLYRVLSIDRRAQEVVVVPRPIGMVDVQAIIDQNTDPPPCRVCLQPTQWASADHHGVKYACFNRDPKATMMENIDHYRRSIVYNSNPNAWVRRVAEELKRRMQEVP